MAVVLTRRITPGLTSSLNVVTVILQVFKFHLKHPIIVDIPLNNYACTWQDLFEDFISRDTPIISTYDADTLYFQTPESLRPGYETNFLLECREIILKYLIPKKYILDRVEDISAKYCIPDVTCVYFRGTDMLDRPRASLETYYTNIPPTGRLWIQSDEKAFVDVMLAKHPDRAFTIDGFKFSDRAIHHAGQRSDAEEVLIIVYLMVKCKYLIANISGVPWHALMLRGNTDNYTVIH